MALLISQYDHSLFHRRHSGQKGLSWHWMTKKPLTLENLTLTHDAFRLRPSSKGKNVKKLINRSLIQIESRHQQGKLSCPATIAESNKKKTDSFPGKDSANEKHWTLLFFAASHLHSPLYKTALFPLLSGNLQVVHHDNRTQTVILCWF